MLPPTDLKQNPRALHSVKLNRLTDQLTSYFQLSAVIFPITG